MKKHFLLLALLFVVNVFSQVSKQDQHITGHEILSDCYVLESLYNIKQSDRDMTKMSNLQMILDLDVYSYFDLNGKYNSKLKRKYFEQTEDYQKFREKIKNKKSKVFNNWYVIKGSKDGIATRFNSQGIYALMGENKYVINYDLNKKGFFIPIGDVSYLGCSRFVSNTISDFEFKKAMITKKWNKQKDGFKELLFVPVSEKMD